MSLSDLKEKENKFHKIYNDIKVEFQPKLVVCITVLRCREISVSFLGDAIDMPDPLIVVSVPSLPTPNKFKTSGHDNSPTTEINETFNFVVPPDFEPKSTPCLVKVQLYDSDILFADGLGTKEFNVYNWTPDVIETKTLVFGSHGEVDIEVKVQKRLQPDFRFGFGLCDEECEFRMKRLPIVHKCLQDVLGHEAPLGLDETPVISLCASGGGFRAIVAMAGLMEAFQDAGLMDVFSYIAALSGSAGYLESACVHKGLTSSSQKVFHKFLKKAAQTNLLTKGFDPVNLASFASDVRTKQKFDQPVSICDFFSLTTGNTYLGKDRMTTCQSDLQDYIGRGRVPFPLVVSLVVKNTQLASEFHAYMECSPYEVSYPNYGIGISPKYFGSVWNSGILARKCPELPCYFHIGITSSFLGILNTTPLSTGEKDKEFLNLRQINDDNGHEKLLKRNDLLETTAFDMDGEKHNDVETLGPLSGGAEDSTKSWYQMLKDIFLSSRVSVVWRTSTVFNFCKNLDPLPFRKLNPFGGTKFVGPAKEELEKLYQKDERQNISTKKDLISMIDAGLYNNVPAVVLLRPQRTVDLMIVADFTIQPSDEDFSNLELFATAAHCWQNGLKFPSIDFRKIARSPPTECMVFMDENDELCPIVVWFQLSNTKFKNLKDYKPRSKVTYDSSEGQFNDFAMFGPGTPYKALVSGFSELQQDRLKELMYFNVSSNLQVIKDALVKATENKKKRIHGQRMADF